MRKRFAAGPRAGRGGGRRCVIPAGAIGGDAGRHGEADHARRHPPAQRAGVAYAPIPAGMKAYFSTSTPKRRRQARRLRPPDQLELLRRRVQPGEHGPADAQARRAGQGLRDARRSRHREPAGGAGLPERARRCRSSSSRPARPSSSDYTTAPVDDRLAAGLRGRGHLRQVHREEPAEREDRRALPERRLRQRLPARPQGGPRAHTSRRSSRPQPYDLSAPTPPAVRLRS